MKVRRIIAAAVITVGIAAATVFNVSADTNTSVAYTNTHESEIGALSEQNKKIYREAKKQILEIAEGKRTNAILRINVKDVLGIDVNDSKYEVSLSQLNSFSDKKISESNFDANGRGDIAATVAWQAWAENSARNYFGYYNNGEWKKINHALWNGCGYELYWHDRAVKGIDVWPISIVLKENGRVGLDEDSFIPIALSVRSEYRTADTSSDMYNVYYSSQSRSMEIDQSKLKAVAEKTVPAAKAIVEKYKDLSDYEKLEAYRDYILEQVSYDREAEKLIGSSTDEQTDAFFVTNVFDNDPSTNVVCEGYAKAFKFLCDLSTFEDPTLDVNMVTGECTISTGMSSQTENHMWNIVTYHGKNYIVDLTNSDEGTMGENGNLFMVPASRSTDYSNKVYNNISGIYIMPAEEGQSSSRISWSARYCYSTKEDTYKDYNDSFAPSSLEIASVAENSFNDANEAAAYLAEQMKARNNRIVFSYTGSTSGFTTDSFRELLNRSYTHTGEAGLGDNLRRQIDEALPATANTTYIYNVEYRNTKEQEAQLEKMVPDVLESLNLEGKSDYQKTKAIYDWICKNISYDRNRDGSNLQRYTAAYAMIRKSAVCEGYANLFYYMASAAGLENRIVVSSDHAWNIVKLGDRYYNVDTTWDAGRYSSEQSWRFFLKSDAKYTDMNYYEYNDHHVRLSSDMVTDADFIAAHPVSLTDYGTTENGITFKENNGTVTITGYTGEEADVVVPSEIAGEPIGKITAGAFADEKITSVTFTSDAAEIEKGAFHANVKLLLDPACTKLIAYAKENNLSTGDVPIEQAENAWVEELTCASVEKGETVAPHATAKFGDVVYTYAASEDGEYTEEAPTAPGAYFVKAAVAETEAYTGLESTPVAFEITKPKNEWTTALTIDDIYVGDIVAPIAKAKYGTVRFVYSVYSVYGSMEYTDAVPTAAGSYSVKAIVDETDEYTGLESSGVTFYIDKKTNKWTTALSIADITEGETLAPIAAAEHGTVKFTYAASSYGPFTEDVPTAAGTYYVKASVDADDQYNALTSSAVRFTIKEAVSEEDPEVTELKKQLEEAKKAQEEAEAEKAEAETKLAEVQASANEAVVKLAEAEQKLAEAEQKLAEAEQKLAESEQKITGAEADVKAAQEAKAAAEAERNAALSEKNIAVAEKDAAVAEKEASDKELSAANAAIKELNAELDKVKAELELANADESKAVELQKKLDEANAALDQAKTETETAKQEAEEAKAEAQTLRDRVAEAVKAAEDAKKAEEEAKAAIEEKNAQISALNEQLQNAAASVTTAEEAKAAAEQKYAESEAKLAEAENKVKEADAAKAAAEAALEKVTADAKASEEEKNAAVKAKEDAEAAAKLAESERDAAKLAKAAAEGEKAATEKELSAANASITELNAEITKLKAELALVDADETKAVELQKELDEANKALESAKADTEAAKAEAEVLRKGAEEAKKAQEAAEAAQENLKAELAAAQEALKKAEEEAAKIREEAERTKEEAEKAKDEAEKAKNEAEKSKEDAEKAKEEAAKAREEAEKAKAEAEELRRQAEEAAQNKKPVISYTTHVENIGWQAEVSNGQMAGTSGQALRLEGIKINIANSKYSGGIEYTTHVQNIGWQGWKSNGALSGTSGQALRLEAIKIRLTGELAEHYDVYYQVHAENFGWLGWAKNGAPAGTGGYAYRLEGIRIMLVEKNDTASVPTSNVSAYKRTNLVSYTTHVQDIGWQANVKDGAMSGTSGQAKRLEGIKINLVNPDYSGSIEYSTHVQDIGWQDYAANGAVAGTSGQAKRLEGIKIRLTGEMAEHYDVVYRVHVQNIGWTDWVKNGEMAGTNGKSLRLEGIEIKLVEK